MRTLNGVDSAWRILQQRPAAGVVILTFQTNESQVMAALRAGIRGYVLKTESSDDLEPAVCEVARRGTYFSPGIPQIVVAAYLTGRGRRGARSRPPPPGARLLASGDSTTAKA